MFRSAIRLQAERPSFHFLSSMQPVSGSPAEVLIVFRSVVLLGGKLGRHRSPGCDGGRLSTETREELAAHRQETNWLRVQSSGAIMDYGCLPLSFTRSSRWPVRVQETLTGVRGTSVVMPRNTVQS